jgi:NADH:ubiquinone oxidoreductase subunit 4 (subunit M)
MFLISYYLYQFNYSRRLMLTKGILVRTSVLPLLWFLILITNMAAPPSFNLGSEIIVIRRVMNFLNCNWIYLSLIVFLRTVYTLIIYSSSTQGVKIAFSNFKILNLAETLRILNHLIWGFILVLRITIFTV